MTPFHACLLLLSVLYFTHRPTCIKSASMDPAKINTPDIKDMNIDNITENTILINSQGDSERVKYLFERLVTHLHDFARETRLSTKEWKTALDFLVSVGQISSNVRHVSFFPPIHPNLHYPGIPSILMCKFRSSSSFPMSSASPSSSFPSPSSATNTRQPHGSCQTGFAALRFEMQEGTKRKMRRIPITIGKQG